MAGPDALPRLDAARVLALGGILFVACGMVLGEIYAIYISHVANGIIQSNWIAIVEATAKGDLNDVTDRFSVIADLTTKRGRTMNSHSHLAAFGLLAFVLALLQPHLDMSSRARLKLAIMFLAGCFLQVGGVYVSYYTSEALLYLSDAGAVLLTVSVGGVLWSLWKSRARTLPTREELARQLQPCSSRYLLKSGLLLILIGMSFGLYYAWQLVSIDEPAVYEAIDTASAELAAANVDEAIAEITRFKRLQSKIAITAAAHSHAIEFGFLMLLLAFIQRFVMLSEIWRLRWAQVLSVGAYLLPVCVLLATHYGLRAAAFSDIFGAFVLIGLVSMAYGLIRYTGAADAAGGASK